MKTPRRGEIWQVNLNPTSGREQQGMRPVLVISPEAFNRSGLCWVCPITQGGLQSRFAGFSVTLMGSGSATQGVVACNQIRTLDLASRQGKWVESLSATLIEEVLARVRGVVE